MEQALLETGGHGSAAKAPRPWARALARTTAAAGAACGAALLATGLFLGGAEYGRTTPHAGQARGVSLEAMNMTQAGAATSLSVKLTLGCYAYTGGTCHFNECDTGRHAHCSSSYLCVCGDGKCADVNGICGDDKNEFVASGFTLTNVKFGDQAMYMTATDPTKHIKTTAAPSFLNGNTDKWTLYEMPGEVSVGYPKKGYFLSTKAFPGYVAAAQATAGMALSPFAAFEVGLYKEKSPSTIAVRICARDDGTLMIGSPGATSADITQWFYIHHGSWEVFTWGLGDPGPGGYWKADPPLPIMELCGKM